MTGILRAQPGWQEAIGRAVAGATRPIAADERFSPRDTTGRLNNPRWDRSSFPAARKASTLLLVYPGDDGDLTVPLTLRHAGLPAHPGEVSLPGGAVDPGDASREAAALREAHEEVGVDPATVRIAGALDDIWIPVSNFELRPFVGTATVRPTLVAQTDEVAEIVELPLRLILTDAIVGEEEISGASWVLRAAVYRHGGQRIWGATARTLAMFAAVLAEAQISE
ncbi:MAG: CoA pyrophosphatase [Chloroflexota bacterium]|nr:CoA pyrophosphatase [Chloroflexota bacterium]